MVIRFFAIVSIPLLFFIVALGTLRDYGISWDQPIHFYRGQAYLHYILTGKTKFDQDKRSYYQSDQLPAEYWLEKDDGHPPLNGIIASVFNLIFYQKLGLLGDIESYHLFNILASSILVLVVVLFAWETYGAFAAAVAGVTIASYPLLFAEGHFNIKDPPQTAFFALTVWAFWKSLGRGWKWVLVSAISSGFALGTKFNILFLPLIILPYLIFRYGVYLRGGWHKLFGGLKLISKSYIVAFFASPFIVFLIFFITWPFLWQDPLYNFVSILRWYKDIGTGPATFGYFFANGFNAYAPIWILITSPPWVLVLTSIGIVAAVIRRKERGFASLLWLLWFIIPIARVVIPNTTIYGGSRQIMEFLPAMALLAGLGASYSTDLAAKHLFLPRLIVTLALLLGFVPHFIIMIKMHPNQNVYFNSLVGGLYGAREHNIPYWGNSFGNAYWQVVQWLNSNAPQDSKLALIQGTSLNIPRIKLRDDLRFSNSFWSGIYRDGEYLIELTHHDKRFYPYAWEYVETFLEPVFEVKVDGVAIAKVWRNDLENTKSEFKKNEVILDNSLVSRIGEREVILDIGKTAQLTRLIVLNTRQDCMFLRAYVSTSISGEDWLHEQEQIPEPSQLTYREKESLLFQPFFFPAREARFIKLETFQAPPVKLKESQNNSCAVSGNPIFRVYVLED